MIAIDNPRDIALAQLFVVRARLKLELAGMTSATNTLAWCKRNGFTGTTRGAALAWVIQKIDATP